VGAQQKYPPEAIKNHGKTMACANNQELFAAGAQVLYGAAPGALIAAKSLLAKAKPLWLK
jgi:precorrin isomerase